MKILFVSPFCLLDPSSGASISCRQILEGLAARGHESWAISSTIFDRPQFPTTRQFLEHIGADRLRGNSGRPSSFWRCRREGVTFLIAPSRAQFRSEMTSSAESLYQRLVMLMTRRIAPDVIFTYG